MFSTPHPSNNKVKPRLDPQLSENLMPKQGAQLTQKQGTKHREFKEKLEFPIGSMGRVYLPT